MAVVRDWVWIANLESAHCRAGEEVEWGIASPCALVSQLARSTRLTVRRHGHSMSHIYGTRLYPSRETPRFGSSNVVCAYPRQGDMRGGKRGHRNRDRACTVLGSRPEEPLTSRPARASPTVVSAGASGSAAAVRLALRSRLLSPVLSCARRAHRPRACATLAPKGRGFLLIVPFGACAGAVCRRT